MKIYKEKIVDAKALTEDLPRPRDNEHYLSVGQLVSHSVWGGEI